MAGKNVRIRFLGLLLLVVSMQAVALEQAHSVQDLMTLAEQGQSQAQYELAMSYQRGQEVAQDYAEAVKWLEKAAGQRHLEAELQLGMMYFSGQGVARDNVRAAEWFRRVAEQKAATASRPLYTAKAILPDAADDLALWWLERSAEQGLAQAQYLLSRAFAQLNLPVKALQWALIAAQGNRDTSDWRDKLRQQLSASERKQAEQLAQAWRVAHPQP